MITSTANTRVKLLRSLADRRHRLREGLFLIEGVRLAEEAVEAGVHPALAFYDPAALEATERGRLLLTDLQSLCDELEPAAPHVLASISEVQHGQGVVLGVPLPLPPPPPRKRRPGALHDAIVLLDELADPGNAGAILRSARAAGVGAVYVAAGSVDVFGPKVVRAAAGAHFWLPIHPEFRWSEVDELAPRPAQTLLAEAHRGVPYTAVDWTKPTALIIGGEAHGASASARHAADERVRIPMPGGGDSLNVAMATAILLFEAVRQRLESAAGA